jgi:penicillin-binding protein 2
MYFIAGMFCLLFLVLLCGLFDVQIRDYPEMRRQEKLQNQRRILIPGPRGDIYDREGRLLVGNRPLYSAVVYLNELRGEFRKEYFAQVDRLREKDVTIDRNTVATASRLAVVQRYMDKVNEILGTTYTLNARRIESQYSSERLLPLTLRADLTQEQYARLIEQLPVDSPIQIVAESARYYPYGRLAAHALGYVVASDEVNYDDAIGSDELRTFRFKGKVGRAGLELSFDQQLQGTPGGEIWVVDPNGYQHRRTDFRAPVKGADIVTSIDIDLQRAAELALGDHTGAVVAMDVKTGEVLVMASEPAYDLNDLSPFIPTGVYNDIRDRGAWINRAIQGLYPPGSTFKIITAICGYIEGKLDERENIYCPGYLMVGNRRFYCDVREGHGEQNLRQAIGNSCNVYFYTMGLRVGVDALSRVGRMFGLDKQTGVELPAESRSSVVPDPAYKMRRFYENWFQGDTANMAIGQGFLLVTPMQMCAFTASFARGMTTTTPTMLKVTPGQARQLGGEPIPIAPGQYRAIAEGMRKCVVDGTGLLVQRQVQMPVAGKTGTAQIRINGRESTIAWFICYAPYDDPQIAIAVMIEGVDPGDNLFGGSTSAPIAREVLRAWEAKHMPPNAR